MNHLAGGRLFPGEHQRATFRSDRGRNDVSPYICRSGSDGRIEVDVVGHTAAQLDASSSFSSVGDASAFSKVGVGYSVTSSGSRLDGVVLKTESWSVEPLAVEQAHSTYFGDSAMFPAGSITFDCGLIMRNIPHEWESAKEMYI